MRVGFSGTCNWWVGVVWAGFSCHAIGGCGLGWDMQEVVGLVGRRLVGWVWFGWSFKFTTREWVWFGQGLH